MAERFVNRNVGIGSSTPDIAGQILTDLSEDMIIADHALILRPQKFAPELLPWYLRLHADVGHRLVEYDGSHHR